MPRKKTILEPVKLRVIVDCELHHRLIRLCGRRAAREGRLVKMGEIIRLLLDKAADQELSDKVTR